MRRLIVTRNFLASAKIKIHPHQCAGIAAYRGDEMRTDMAPELRIPMLILKKHQEWDALIGKMLLHPICIFCDPPGVPCGHIGSIFARLGSRVWGLGFGPYIFL